MTAKSDYLENAILNHNLRNVPFTSPTTVYLALFLDNPGEAAGGTEVSGGSYARRAVTFAAPAGGSCSNSAVVTFPTATADWGTVTHAAIMDSLTGGNVMYYGILANPATVLITQTFQMNAGALGVREL